MATNTSSIMIENIAEPLADPGRLIGIHFFNPVAQMPLVEVIKGERSREDEVQKGCAFVTAIDKFPLIAKSSPGFVVNRVLGPYMMAALQRVERGESKEKIDEAARAFGMPMGPVELADTVGLDVCASVGNILKMAPAGGSKLDQMVASGKLGKKSGEGFYVWKDGKAQKAQPEKPWDKVELERLGRELVDPLIRECERVRDERIVESAESGRCRRDLRHRVCALPWRAAALRCQRTEIEYRGAAQIGSGIDASALADPKTQFPKGQAGLV